MRNEAWVLGATGRTGQAVARRLHERGIALVLVGRNRDRLAALADALGGAPRLVVGTLEANLAALAQDAPGVVVNTVGPFAATAPVVARACPPGTHYVDVSDEHASVADILSLGQRAIAARQTLVAASGFGALATESVVLRLCEGQPPAARVRVDALPSVALEAGMVGAALAATIVEVASQGGREVQDGRLVNARAAAHPLRITTPDGHVLATASGATAELLAAWRASQAESVIAASMFVPTNAVLRFVLPAVGALFRIPGVSRFAVSQMARIPTRAQDRPRPYSWGHARVEWTSGLVREGWLRLGDGMDFTAAAVVEVTQRLLRGEGTPGAYTAGALFGPALAEAAGGMFIIEQDRHAADRR